MCLEKVFCEGFSYRKAGVILTELVSAETLPQRLFEEEKLQRFRRLTETVDKINRKFGRDKVHFAIAKPKGDWRGKSEHRSNRFTTKFKEILTVT